jgi:hypothetical protein
MPTQTTHQSATFVDAERKPLKTGLYHHGSAPVYLQGSDLNGWQGLVYDGRSFRIKDQGVADHLHPISDVDSVAQDLRSRLSFLERYAHSSPSCTDEDIRWGRTWEDDALSHGPD